MSSTTTLPLYREPDIGRFAEAETAEMPSMSPTLKESAGEHFIAVSRKKGDWLKIIYDDSGREGWVKQARQWEYYPWEIFLKGREVRLLNGILKEFYNLRATHSSKARTAEVLTCKRSLRVIEVEDNWMLVIVDLVTSGWIRWRDDDGRFLISVD